MSLRASQRSKPYSPSSLPRPTLTWVSSMTTSKTTITLCSTTRRPTQKLLRSQKSRQITIWWIHHLNPHFWRYAQIWRLHSRSWARGSKPYTSWRWYLRRKCSRTRRSSTTTLEWCIRERANMLLLRSSSSRHFKESQRQLKSLVSTSI
jgi:hypothetical protein